MNYLKILVEKKHRLIVGIFFVILFCIGLSVFKDYGISWDEPRSRYNGYLSIRYMVLGDARLLSYTDKYYGTAFEMLLVSLEMLFNLKDIRAVYLMRHFVTFCTFYVSLFFFYLLCRNRFGSWKIGILGVLFLFLSPRIFADSFYNSKDLVFMSIFVISVYTLLEYLGQKNVITAVLHALVCAFLIGTRVAGVILPALTILFLAPEARKDKAKIAASFLVYFALLLLFTLASWPILWQGPFYHLSRAFLQMGKFLWQFKVLYLGTYIKPESLPWHYIPVWILITTPLAYSVFLLLGLIIFFKEFLSGPLRFYREKKEDLLFILWFIAPLSAVIALKSTLYDAWRHLFFIYPATLLFSLKGLVSFFRIIKKTFGGTIYKLSSIIVLLFLGFNLINVAIFMVRYHPYQHLYFNILVGSMQKAKSNFDLDYWGLTYRKALEYILNKDCDRNIKVYVEHDPGVFNADILDPEDRGRLEFVDTLASAKYFLSNFRWQENEYPFKHEFYSIKIDNAKVMVVYKLTHGA